MCQDLSFWRDLCHVLAMAFTTDIESPCDITPPAAFQFAAEILDRQWIEDALDATGTQSIRRRKLPADAVVWLVIAMALFRDRSIHAAASQLGLATERDSPGRPSQVVPAAVAQARARLGDLPLEWLFRRSAESWAIASAQADRWHGLAVFAVDGTSFNTADTPENETHFGRSQSGRTPSAYPKVRVVALNVPRSHLLADLAIGPYGTSEQELAENLWGRVPSNSITIVDRGFLAYHKLLARQDAERGRHWLVRAKANTAATTIRRLADGSELVTLSLSSQARKADPSLPKTMTARLVHYQVPGFKPQRLLTSLLDPVAYPARDVAELYHERWEIELGFAEKKTHMLERREALRSKTPTGTLQELWGVAIAYNVVRLMMTKVAEGKGLPPRRISFRNALLLVRAFALSAWHVAPGALPKLLVGLRRDIAQFVLPERRLRLYPRHVKIKMSNYKKKPIRGAQTAAQSNDGSTK